MDSILRALGNGSIYSPFSILKVFIVSIEMTQYTILCASNTYYCEMTAGSPIINLPTRYSPFNGLFVKFIKMTQDTEQSQF